MKYIKFEVLLPLKYNDHRIVEKKKFTETIDDIVERCRGITLDNAPLIGAWIDPETNQKVSDEVVVYWAICYDTEDNMQFLKSLKDKLKKRFDQKEILLYYLLIERL